MLLDCRTPLRCVRNDRPDWGALSRLSSRGTKRSPTLTKVISSEIAALRCVRNDRLYWAVFFMCVIEERSNLHWFYPPRP